MPLLSDKNFDALKIYLAKTLRRKVSQLNLCVLATWREQKLDFQNK